MFSKRNRISALQANKVSEASVWLPAAAPTGLPALTAASDSSMNGTSFSADTFTKICKGHNTYFLVVVTVVIAIIIKIKIFMLIIVQVIMIIIVVII
jgi:hypothetical protein